MNLRRSDCVGRRVHVVVDRPLGSTHPDHSFTYEINYGYIPGTVAPDGEPLDAYVIDIDEPLDECDGEVIAIIRRRDDVEDKLVVCVGGEKWSHRQISDRTRFQEQWYDTYIEGA